MPIYEPKLLLSKTDREILFLLGQLVTGSLERADSSNLDHKLVSLSPSEARKLLELLEEFAESKLFIEGAYFSETLANDGGAVNDRLREIYLSWRSRRGHSRVASSYTWREFTLRAGFDTSSEAWMWPRRMNRSPLRPMTLDHFAKMEDRLTKSADLNPRVAALVNGLVQKQLPILEKVRNNEMKVEEGALRKFVGNCIENFSDQTIGKEKEPMSRNQLVALLTIVMDVSALFATRDWTAAGVLSALAAVSPDALNYPSDD